MISSPGPAAAGLFRPLECRDPGGNLLLFSGTAA